jgi:hypothetical protein
LPGSVRANAARLHDRVKELQHQFDSPSGPAKALARKTATALSCRKRKKHK